MQLAAATALLGGAAGLNDKVADGDLPAVARSGASKIARRFNGYGEDVASRCGLDPRLFARANDEAVSVESRSFATLDDILAPSGAAVAAVFAQTAVLAGVPENRPFLARAGDAFGRLVHLLDAVEDRLSDSRQGRFNPLQATGTSLHEARMMAESLHDHVLTALRTAAMDDRSLLDALFGPTLQAGIDRVLPPPDTPRRHRTTARHHRLSAGGAKSAAAVGIAATMLGQAAMFSGRRRRGGYYGDPYYGGRGYGPGRRGGCGPSCGEMLACDCCANLACNDCCGGDDCCCCA
jgi:hypothetical protein